MAISCKENNSSSVTARELIHNHEMHLLNGDSDSHKISDVRKRLVNSNAND